LERSAASTFDQTATRVGRHVSASGISITCIYDFPNRYLIMLSKVRIDGRGLDKVDINALATPFPPPLVQSPVGSGGSPGSGPDFLLAQALRLAAGVAPSLALVESGFDILKHPPTVEILAPQNIPTGQAGYRSSTNTFALGVEGSLAFFGAIGNGQGGFYWCPGLGFGVYASSAFGALANRGASVGGIFTHIFGDPNTFAGASTSIGVDISTIPSF
jgi:hypothetical protein